MSTVEGPVSINSSDHAELIDLLNQVFRDEGGGDMGRQYERHLGLNNRELVRVIKEDSKIVSHVATSVRQVSLAGIRTAVAGIGAVATLEQARGKGYASKLMSDAVERSLDEGADIMLISGDEGIYKRMHAVYCGRFPVLELSAADCKPDLNGYVLVEATKNDIDSIIQLRQHLNTRYLLPREDIEALFDSKWVMDKPSSWWMAVRDNKAKGFGAIFQTEKHAVLLDWAGSQDALRAAVSLWLDKLQVESIQYVAPDLESMPDDWRAHIRQWRRFEGTVLIINAKRLIERAMPWWIERVGEHEIASIKIESGLQEAKFTLNGETVSFDNGGELARLFFGEPDVSILDEKGLSEGPLRGLLEKLFPIPLVWYGLGYV